MVIVLVIVMENEIVLFDEFIVGLDLVSIRFIVDIIKGLNKNNIKIVIFSYDMNLMYEICDYIYVLDKGILIDEGKVENVFINENNII